MTQCLNVARFLFDFPRCVTHSGPRSIQPTSSIGLINLEMLYTMKPALKSSSLFLKSALSQILYCKSLLVLAKTCSLRGSSCNYSRRDSIQDFLTPWSADQLTGHRKSLKDLWKSPCRNWNIFRRTLTPGSGEVFICTQIKSVQKRVLLYYTTNYLTL